MISPRIVTKTELPPADIRREFKEGLTHMHATRNRRRLNSAESGGQETPQLTIGKSKISLSPVGLLDDDLVEQLRDRISSATAVKMNGWEGILSWPPQARNNLLLLMSVDGPRYAIQVSGSRTIHPDVFAATLALTADPSDLRQVAEVYELATATAAACHPGAIRPAAQKIKEWMAANRVAADRTDVIAARIRQQVGPANQAGQLTPQRAADFVLAEWQQQREQRGDDTSTSPPVWFWNGDWYRWIGKHWRTATELDHEIVRVLQRGTDRELTTAFVAATRMNIAAKIVLQTNSLRLPVYVHDPETIEHRDAIVFANGVIDLQEMIRTGRLPALTPHDPQLFATSSLPYEYDPKADCRLWIETINAILRRREPGDRRVEILQELMGLCLMPWDMSHEAFALLIGSGANGKSTILYVLAHVLGSENVSHVPLEAFSKDAHLVEMAGKWANIASEMHRMQRVEEGTLKGLVSGEPRQVDRKYQRACTVFPSAKLFFPTNHLPPIADTSRGIWRRMIPIPFFEAFVGDTSDLHRKQRLLQELPGILRWSLQGALRLISQGAFTSCDVCNRARDQYQYDSDPFRQFFDECCELNPDSRILTHDLFVAYQGFVVAQGRRPKGSSEFGQQLLSQPGVSKDRESTGERRRLYVGIRLRPGVPGWQFNLSSSRNTARCVLAD